MMDELIDPFDVIDPIMCGCWPLLLPCFNISSELQGTIRSIPARESLLSRADHCSNIRARGATSIGGIAPSSTGASRRSFWTSGPDLSGFISYCGIRWPSNDRMIDPDEAHCRVVRLLIVVSNSPAPDARLDNRGNPLDDLLPQFVGKFP